MNSENVSFTGSQGNRLAAVLDRPEGDVRAYAIFAHCFTCSKNLKIVANVARTLASEGIATLRFDFTGLGQSEGDFAETTFTTNLQDLLAAAEFLDEDHEPPALLVGHSLGGAAVLAATDQIGSARCVATIGAPADTAHVRRLLTDADFDANDRAAIDIGGRPFHVGRELLEDLERHDLEEQIANLDRPLLVFHAPLDEIVGIEHAERIFAAAKHPKSFVSLGDADHLVSDPGAAVFLGNVLAAWATYYVE